MVSHDKVSNDVFARYAGVPAASNRLSCKDLQGDREGFLMVANTHTHKTGNKYPTKDQQKNRRSEVDQRENMGFNIPGAGKN